MPEPKPSLLIVDDDALITAAIAIHETITFLAIIGCVLIIGGVYVAQKRKG